MISKSEYKKRRLRLMDNLGDGILIVSSNKLHTMSNDVEYEFRQQTDLLYLTGFPEPDSISVLEKSEGKVSFYLFVPKKDAKFEIWDGKRYGVDGAKQVFNADNAFPIDNFEEKISDLLLSHEKVFYSLGQDKKLDQIIGDKIQKTMKSKKKRNMGPTVIENPLPKLHSLRAIKTPEEIEILKKSAKISADAIELAMKVTRPDLTERQIEAVIEYHYAKNGCERPAYPSIVGGGTNATILHYIENNSKLRNGDLLLVDAGAEFNNYSADITRTWPVNGKFNDIQRKIYSHLLKIQKEVISQIKPGITINSLQKTAIKKITKLLVDIELIEGEIDKLIEEKSYRRYFMHGIGHWLGMDVHDTGLIDKEHELLKPGHYFTIEPGIYIPNENDISEEYRGIGIRIEDDILVTESGHRILSNSATKEISKIEKIVGTEDLP